MRILSETKAGFEPAQYEEALTPVYRASGNYKHAAHWSVVFLFAADLTGFESGSFRRLPLPAMFAFGAVLDV